MRYGIISVVTRSKYLYETNATGTSQFGIKTKELGIPKVI
jgi:hypothetical protein